MIPEHGSFGHKHLFCTLRVMVCCFFAVSSFYGQSQQINTQTGRLAQQFGSEPEVRERILNLAFPQVLEENQKTEFSLIVRYLPSIHPERQVVIRYYQHSYVSIEYRVARVALQTIVRENDISTMKLEQAVGLMEIGSKSVSVSAQTVLKWFHSFWSSLGESTGIIEKRAMERWVQADGTIYEVNYREHGNTLSLRLWGPEIEPEAGIGRNDPAILGWMLGLLKEIEIMAK